MEKRTPTERSKLSIAFRRPMQPAWNTSSALAFFRPEALDQRQHQPHVADDELSRATASPALQLFHQFRALFRRQDGQPRRIHSANFNFLQHDLVPPAMKAEPRQPRLFSGRGAFQDSSLLLWLGYVSGQEYVQFFRNYARLSACSSHGRAATIPACRSRFSGGR